ncbi:MAG: ABC transporter permease subunit [Holosporales bacterium]|jgi:putrescine transport system permease protein|nr:ABC transporter permease subunit [Holosporales bacterium]
MKIRFIPVGLTRERKKSKKQFWGIYKNMENKFRPEILPLLWILLFFIAPLFIVLKISFAESIFKIPPFSEVFKMVEEHLLEIRINLKNYVAIIHDSYYVTTFLNSVLLSISATLVCTLFGLPMAYGIHNARDNIKSILLLSLSLSFWTSILIRIYSWMNLLSTHGIVNTLLLKSGVIDFPIQFQGNYYTICLGMVFCYLPFMIFPIYAVLEKIDRSYIESAYNLGCRSAKVFWAITVPLSKEGLLTGCILVFATSMGEFVIPELLGSAETITFGRVLWNEFFTNLDWPMACALSIAMMLFVILPIFVFQKKAGL